MGALQRPDGRVKPVELAAYTVGALLILSGVAHLAVLVAGGGSWDGPVSMRKPMTFGLSFGLTLINVTLLASYVPLKNRSRALLLGAFAAACLLETVLVSVQAWRGVPSHFNIETPFDATVAQALAIGGFTLVALIVVLTVAVFRHAAALPPPMRLALQAGFVALVGAQAVGGVMIATGMRLVFSGDAQRAYSTAGWLKPAHGVLMHGILVLPLLAWLTAKLDWDERRQVRAVGAGAILYAVAVAAVIVSVQR
jgi:hypothetical protein